MKRTLIIDAYNYIFAGNKQSVPDIENARNELIEFMVDFGAKNSDYDEIIVVFDGQQKQTINKLGITILFSEKRKSADQTIEKLIATSEDKRNVTLVSNDNVSRNLAAGFGAKTFSTEWFQSKVADSNEIAASINNKVYRNTIEDNIDPKIRLKLNEMIGRT